MAEPASTVAGGLLAKLLPAGIGAAIMIAVDMPATKREWFARIFVAFAFSYAFYGLAFDFTKSIPWFSFLDKNNEDHQFAIRALLGATGWFVMGGAAMVLKKFRKDPVAAVADVKKSIP